MQVNTGMKTYYSRGSDCGMEGYKGSFWSLHRLSSMSLSEISAEYDISKRGEPNDQDVGYDSLDLAIYLDWNERTDGSRFMVCWEMGIKELVMESEE